MNSFFSEIGIRAIDFIQISVMFVGTMLCFYGTPHKKYLNMSMLLVFALQCIFFILFGDGLRVKVFAGLMLLSTLMIELLLGKRKTSESAQSPTAS